MTHRCESVGVSASVLTAGLNDPHPTTWCNLVQWLTYWVVVCTLMVLEKLLWPVLMWCAERDVARAPGRPSACDTSTRAGHIPLITQTH